MLQKALSRILGFALLLYGCAAVAFTLPPAPTEEQGSPSNTITDATTLETQVQPIAGTIRAQLLGLRRPQAPAKSARLGAIVAANSHAASRSDVDLLATGPGSGSGGGDGGDGGDSQSVWISAATNSLENHFYRTAFYGATNNLLVGFDATRTSKYVMGVAIGHEASNFTTTFNSGNEKTRGINVNPYFAWLLTDSLSLDLIFGYGQFTTQQTRTLGGGTPPPFGTLTMNSEFDSTRGFVSTNLSNVWTAGDWKVIGALGYLGSRRDQDGYVEQGALGATVPGSKQTAKQWNLLGEAAYGRGNSEVFFGALYENTRDAKQVVFASGDQPANDPDSVMLNAGWRYFGKGLTASFVFTSRQAQEDVSEYGFSMVVRVDL